MNPEPDIVGYVAERIRRAVPLGGHVVPRSTPVVSFGDHTRARVATVGINPSSREFQDGRKRLLPDDAKRLADLDLLEAESSSDLPDPAVATVMKWCRNYFQHHPYTRWFDKLNALVRGAGADFYDGTACHLDLVQWATDPVWGAFPKADAAVQAHLLAEDAPFLRRQLRAANIELVLLNGRKVIEQVERLEIVTLQDRGSTPVGKQGKRSRRLEGFAADGTRYLGWTLNASHSQTTDDNRAALAAWIGQVTG